MALVAATLAVAFMVTMMAVDGASPTYGATIYKKLLVNFKPTKINAEFPCRDKVRTETLRAYAAINSTQ